VLVVAGVAGELPPELADELADELAPGLADEMADELAEELADELEPAPMALTTLAEQTTRAPPPLAEPLHWLIVTGWAEAIVPVAVQVRPTGEVRVKPLAEPLHWVIAAPVIVLGKGSQWIVWPTMPPAPEPTHWFTVAAVEPGLTLMKLFVTLTLQRSVPPPPLIESLH
jgi:hypothetical protein